MGVLRPVHLILITHYPFLMQQLGYEDKENGNPDNRDRSRKGISILLHCNPTKKSCVPMNLKTNGCCDMSTFVKSVFRIYQVRDFWEAPLPSFVCCLECICAHRSSAVRLNHEAHPGRLLQGLRGAAPLPELMTFGFLPHEKGILVKG